MDKFTAYMVLLQHRLQNLREESERGSLSVEAVLLIGFVVAAALAVGAFLVAYVNNKLGAIK